MKVQNRKIDLQDIRALVIVLIVSHLHFNVFLKTFYSMDTKVSKSHNHYLKN